MVKSQGHRLWEKVRNALASSLNTAASSFNTLHLCPIGPKKVSPLNSSSRLAGIVCINPWSLRKSSIRSSCRRCLCGCTATRVYTEVAATIPPTEIHRPLPPQCQCCCCVHQQHLAPPSAFNIAILQCCKWMLHKFVGYLQDAQRRTDTIDKNFH